MTDYVAQFGESDAGWARNEHLAYLHLRGDWQPFEVSLYRSKWFDYRFMHHIEASQLFASAYRDAYKHAFASNVDTGRSEYVRGFPGQDLFDPKVPKTTLAGIMRARQHADAIGCPYDFYCHHAIKKATSWRRDYLPRPTQLYSGQITEYVVEKWEEAQAARLYLPEDERYRNQAYVGAPAQNDCHEYLFKQAEIRADRVKWLNRFVRDQRLPIAKVETRYGAEMRQAVEAYV